MVSQKLRWKHRKNRSNLSSLVVPGSTAKLPQSNHSTFALRTVEEQAHLQLQQAEFQDRSQEGSLQREVTPTSIREGTGLLSEKNTACDRVITV